MFFGVMNEGWDYSFWNDNGKNVFFLLDTCHICHEIQNKLVIEGLNVFRKRNVPIFFAEGAEGSYDVNLNMDDDDWKKSEVDNYGYWSAKVYLPHLIKRENSFIHFYGADSKKLVKNQMNLIKDIHNSFIYLKDRENLEDYSYFFNWKKNKSKRVSKMRSNFCGNVVSEVMNYNNFNLACLIFGVNHFKDISDNLLSKDIGFASYNPGEGKVSSDKIKKYVSSFNSS